MVEHRFLSLKRWAHLLCDYFRTEDQTQEAIEELKDDVIVQRMAGLVSEGVVVSTECAIVVFSVSCRPNLVSHLFLCFSLCLWSASDG